MRYIGNKTKLLGFIGRVLRARGIAGGLAVDPFTGTASVARALKRWGFRVVASDVLALSYVFGRAYVQTAREPTFETLRPELDGEPTTLAGAVARLQRVEPAPGFLHEHFTPGGGAGGTSGRMYFTPENAARIDASRATLERWRREARVGDDAFHLLLAALIEAADRVANTAGVYASYIKSWQSNATRSLHLRVPRVVPGNGCRADIGDATELVAALEAFDLLYLDPPYTTRQYPAYYHVPEIIAEGWFDDAPTLRGKVGLLRDDAHKRSDWARRSACVGQLERLLEAADCRHVVLSYNSEGILPEPEIERLLRAWGRAGSYRRYTRTYRRYRADSDGENRRYLRDRVQERLYCASR